MEDYFSKISIDREKKQFILNEESLQSLDADSGSVSVIVVAPIKEEKAEEKTIYIINTAGSNIGSDKKEDEYLREIFPPEKVRKVTIIKNEDGENVGIVDISDDIIASFNRIFGETAVDMKLVYQESVSGDMKSLKDIYNIKGIYHKISKLSFKKNVIGKSSDVDNIEEVVQIKKGMKDVPKEKEYIKVGIMKDSEEASAFSEL
jgi:hypothetical protein